MNTRSNGAAPSRANTGSESIARPTRRSITEDNPARSKFPRATSACLGSNSSVTTFPPAGNARANQMVLYPRCAHNFRSDPASYAQKYYTENVRLFIGVLGIPAAVGGAAALVIRILYDVRYAEAGFVLAAFMLRAALLALSSSSEDMLFATGETNIILIGNGLRFIWTIAASLAGYYLFGFAGFVYGVATNNLPPLVYNLWLQRRKHLLYPKYETYKVAYLCVVAACAYLASNLILTLFSNVHLRA